MFADLVLLLSVQHQHMRIMSHCFLMTTAVMMTWTFRLHCRPASGDMHEFVNAQLPLMMNTVVWQQIPKWQLSVAYLFRFSADRSKGRAYATVLRLSVVCLSVTLCIVAKRCVLEQKLLWRAYRKLYMRYRLVTK